MKTHRYYLAIIALVLAALGCGTSLTPKADNAPADAENIPTEQPTQGIEESQGEQFITGPGVEVITLLTETQSAGEKPLLAWNAAPNADYYQLVVFDEEGKPYWAWEGNATQIHLGGTAEPPPPNSSGPIIANGYSWAVVAYNAQGQAIASSALRTISP